MSRGALRFASVADLPQGLRAAAGAAAPAPARKARRDEEHTEQVVFFNRIRTLALNDPRFERAADRTYAIPNGGNRNKRAAGRLKAEGVRAGVADVFVSLPSGKLHGLYIEMKSRTGSPSREQREWLNASVDLGYAAACCRGADEAMVIWRAYVEAGF